VSDRDATRPQQIIVIASIALLGLLVACRRDSFNGEWKSDGPIGVQVARAISAQHVSGCEEPFYKISDNADSRNVLIYCSTDEGNHWSAYLMSEEDEIRQIRPDSDMDPPYLPQLILPK
jgi:hypothetical protein